VTRNHVDEWTQGPSVVLIQDGHDYMNQLSSFSLSMGLFALCGGCRSFDQLGGVKLEEPASALYHFGSDGRLMFVFSSVTAACQTVTDATGPSEDDWWVVSALLKKGWSEGYNSADVYAKVVSSGDAVEYTGVDGFVTLDSVPRAEDAEDGENEIATGQVDFDFGDDGRIRAKFDATYCTENLLQGL